MEQTKIVIHVRGGNIDCIMSNKTDIKIVVVDDDNLEYMTLDERDKIWNKETKDLIEVY